MKKLLFQYKMDVTFTEYVGDHSFTLKCFPESSSRQTIHILQEEITPVTWISHGVDSLQNRYIYGKTAELHNTFSVSVEGEAVVDRSQPEKDIISWDYKEYPTPLTECSEELAALASDYQERFLKEPEHFTEHIYALMDHIYQQMQYVPGSSDLTTSASAAWAQRKGVCQDYSHIMLAICRTLRIPCLYIAGFMVGEGSSHAWVRVYDSYAGRSYDIDPTNHCWVNDEYIDVVIGKDAHDCKMNKGIYKGMALENQKVTVIVKDYDNNETC